MSSARSALTSRASRNCYAGSLAGTGDSFQSSGGVHQPGPYPVTRRPSFGLPPLVAGFADGSVT
jgi:hypothetical protein